MNWIKKLFFSQWEELYSYTSEYITFYNYSGNKIGNTNIETTTCSLLYSKIRNRFKIECSGYIPKDLKGSVAYKKCLNKKLELQK